MINRRGFLRGFVAGVAGLAVPKYFDMGAAWAKHLGTGRYTVDPATGIYTFDGWAAGGVLTEADVQRLWDDFRIQPDWIMVSADVLPRIQAALRKDGVEVDGAVVLDSEGPGKGVVVPGTPEGTGRGVHRPARGLPGLWSPTRAAAGGGQGDESAG